MAEQNTYQVDMDTTPVYQERKRLLFFGLPWTFTKYTVTPSLLTIDRGFLNTVQDDCYMYKIQDVKLNKSLWERLFKLATIICYTGDVTHPEIRLEHIKNADAIKAYILKTSEEARIKRRTLNTMNIDAHNCDAHDDVIDSL
ncbi:MAG: PH domain-containing protein [Lachnospiraceae bacterium]|nr:PH domain-containing protein [Lachnospiraceae bacterium]